MKRNSKKRDSILECIRSAKIHPGAEWIYQKLKPIYPTLSVATVYRNLIQLKEAGLIKSMGKVQGQERFDAALEPHTHAICSRCGKIIDIDCDFVSAELVSRASDITGFEITSSDLQFTGLCDSCKKEVKNG